MLADDPPDTDVVKTWFARALAAGERALPPLTRAGLASRCGVSRQAVDGWARTGRITKKNLTIAAQYFGHGPDFLNQGIKLAQAVPDYRDGLQPWPFKSVTSEQAAQLTPEQLAYIEGMIVGFLGTASGSSAPKRKRAAAGT